MKRRRVLRLSGLTLTVPLGGCASTGGTEEESEFTITRTDTIPVEKRTSEFARSYPGQDPFVEVTVGEKSENRDNLHGVEIYNDYENSVEISITIHRELDGRTLVFDGEGTISINEYMVLAISPPATYTNRLGVRGEDVDLQKIFDVPQSVWNAEPREQEGLSPEHNVHIQNNEIEVRLVGEER